MDATPKTKKLLGYWVPGSGQCWLPGGMSQLMILLPSLPLRVCKKEATQLSKLTGHLLLLLLLSEAERVKTRLKLRTKILSEAWQLTASVVRSFSLSLLLISLKHLQAFLKVLKPRIMSGNACLHLWIMRGPGN